MWVEDSSQRLQTVSARNKSCLPFGLLFEYSIDLMPSGVLHYCVDEDRRDHNEQY